MNALGDTPITEAITVFLAALTDAGYHTDGVQITLPLRVLNALAQEVSLTADQQDKYTPMIQNADGIEFYTAFGRTSFKAAT